MKRASTETNGGNAHKKVDMTMLDRLKQMTVVVADSGDFDLISKYQPQDATTNPSLILAACGIAKYQGIVAAAIEDARKTGLKEDALVEETCDRLVVKFGVEILKSVPGVVSTEVDASLSFDSTAAVAKAKKLVKLYQDEGIDAKQKVLIKLASTWEGIEACRQLEKEGIHCNMTLLFGFAQAVACAEVNATLISPFVGRILDWHKANGQQQEFTGDEDPGVVSVRQIFNYYKKFDYKTTVMGASFRNIDEIISLSGCDKLTISPKLLEELSTKKDHYERALDQTDAKALSISRVEMDEKIFRWMFNEDAMATEKLASGIRDFNRDYKKLVALIKDKFLQ